MPPPIDLRPDHLEIVCQILCEHVPDRKVLAFGSRVNWTAKEYSDLDLAVLGDDPLPLDITSALTEEFSESDLPFKVDIVEWARVDENFRDKISRVGLVVKAPSQKTESCSWEDLPAKNQNGLSTKDEKFQWEYKDSATKFEHRDSGDISLVFGDCANLIRKSIDPVGLPQSTPYVGLEHIQQEELKLSGIGKSSDVVSTKQFFQRGDILFGKLRPYFRKVIYAQFDGICSTDIWVIRPKENFNPKFIFYWCASWDFVNYVNSATEGTRMPRAKWEIACNHHIPKFKIVEQNAIAHLLGTLDEKIELNRCMNNTLEEMAQALFKSWFVDFDPVCSKMEGRDTGLPKQIEDLFPSSLVDSELGKIPEGWFPRKLGECFTLLMGQSPPSSTYNAHGKGLPFFQGRAEFGFRFPKNRKFCTAPTRMASPGDTLISVRAPVGDINMALTKSCIGRGVAALRHNSGSSSFTFYATHSMQKSLRMYEHTGTVFGAINKKQFENLPILNPERKLVEIFDTTVSPVDSRIRRNTLEIELLTDLRDSLLPKLISGQMRMKDLKMAV